MVATSSTGEFGRSTGATVHVLIPPRDRPNLHERGRQRLRASFCDVGDREPNEIGCHRSNSETEPESQGEWLRLQWLYGP
jgi:hypothetical protein